MGTHNLKTALASVLLRTPVAQESSLRLLNRFVWLARFQRWCREHPCPDFPDRDGAYAHVFSEEKLDSPIDYLEFGVWQGRSLRWWLEHNRHPDSRFFGFDTFEGLPEKWEFGGKGQFSTRGEPPAIPDSRCHFEVGLFQNTLPAFLRSYENSRRKVINLDADLYSSTLFVLLSLAPFLQKGDILIFDEFMSFEHEFRAFMDFLSAYPLRFTAVARNWSWCQFAARIEAGRADYG